MGSEGTFWGGGLDRTRVKWEVCGFWGSGQGSCNPGIWGCNCSCPDAEIGLPGPRGLVLGGDPSPQQETWSWAA